MNSVNVNGRDHAVEDDALGAPLADYLRDELGLAGVHLGCRNGDCGSCTVLVDGAPYKSCIVPTGRARGCLVETIEGLADGADLTEVQDSFWRRNAFNAASASPGTCCAPSPHYARTRERAVRT